MILLSTKIRQYCGPCMQPCRLQNTTGIRAAVAFAALLSKYKATTLPSQGGILLIHTCSNTPLRAVASGPAGQAMAGPVLINYVDTHAQMQQLSAMVLLRVEHSAFLS